MLRIRWEQWSTLTSSWAGLGSVLIPPTCHPGPTTLPLLAWCAASWAMREAGHTHRGDLHTNMCSTTESDESLGVILIITSGMRR